MGELIFLQDVASDRFVRRAWDVWAAWLAVLICPTPAALCMFWSRVDQWESDRLRLNIIRRAAA